MYYLATVNWWLYRCFFPRVLCYVVHAEALGPLSAFLSLPHVMYNLFFNNRHETSILHWPQCSRAWRRKDRERMRDHARRSSFDCILHLSFMSPQEAYHLRTIVTTIYYIAADATDCVALLFSDDKQRSIHT